MDGIVWGDCYCLFDTFCNMRFFPNENVTRLQSREQSSELAIFLTDKHGGPLCPAKLWVWKRAVNRSLFTSFFVFVNCSHCGAQVPGGCLVGVKSQDSFTHSIVSELLLHSRQCSQWGPCIKQTKIPAFSLGSLESTE